MPPRRTTSHADGKVESGTPNSAESDGVSQALTSKNDTSVERDEEFLSTSSASERRKLGLSVRKLHHDCGHPPDTMFWCECYVAEVPKITCWHQPDSFVANAWDEAEPPGAKPVSAAHENRKTLESGRLCHGRVDFALRAKNAFLDLCR